MSGSDRPGKRTSIYLKPDLAERVKADGRTLPELIEAGLGAVPPLNFVLDESMARVLLGDRLDEARFAEAVASAKMAARGDTRTGPHVETRRGPSPSMVIIDEAAGLGAVADQAGDVKSLGGSGTEGSARPRRKPGPAAATAPRGARPPAPPSNPPLTGPPPTASQSVRQAKGACIHRVRAGSFCKRCDAVVGS